MTSSSRAVSWDLEGTVGIITVDYPPVNVLSVAVRTGLVECLAQLSTVEAVEAIVLICAGQTFFAGFDIAEFGKPPQPPSLATLIGQLEDSPCPVIAAIHGNALGGGLEVALACHYRVALASARCGLPEVKLGLLPGAGGTQRLPRLVGAELALEMATSGNPITGAALLQSGLVDEIIDDGDLRRGAVAFAHKILAGRQPVLAVKDRQDKILAARKDTALFERFRASTAKKFRGFEAPLANIKAIEAAVHLDFAQGLEVERELFNELVRGTQSAALRHVFFAERQATKIAGIADSLPLLTVNSVGVIGAGTMGGGIAMNFLSAGLPVTIVETSQEALDRGIGTIRRNYEATAKRGRITAQEVEQNMARLTGALALENLATADLIIEAAFEDMEIKKTIFRRLDKLARPGAILATNTSYLDVDEIAAATSRPGDVLGTHFFSPANVMRLLEVVRGAKTSEVALATVMNIAKRIKKVPVVSGVCFGFIGNRMLTARRRESRNLLLEGYLPWEIDEVLVKFGMPMGPFAMADLAGLDIGWAPGASSGDLLRDRFSEAGRRGQKTKAGFYDYDENRNATPSEVAHELIRAFIGESDRPQRTLSPETMLQRMVYPMINEGAKILQEGIASRASDIDVVWINGYGWPAYTGGPMFYADTVGLRHVVETLAAFEQQLGADFAPCALLSRLVEEGTPLSGSDVSVRKQGK